MALRFSLRRAKSAAPVPVPASLPATPSAPRLTARVLSPFQRSWHGIRAAFTALDYAFSWLAVPFGVWVRSPAARYALLLGSFTLIYVVGMLPVGILSLVALGYGYLGVLAIGRAWVLNEKERTAIARKLKDGNPDAMPDLRGTALVAALQLLIIFPLLFLQVQRHFHLYRVADSVSFADWFWFAIDKTYLKALPDWSMLYGVHISSIDFDAPWGRHLVLLSRLTFDYILIQGVLRLLAIRATIGEAVAAVKADPEMAVRLGRRAIGPLLEKLQDPDKAVRGAAANALMQLGDVHAIRQISEAAQG